MKKTLFLLLSVIFSFSAYAQLRDRLSEEDLIFYDYFIQNPTRIYGTMHTYEMKDTSDTAAPEGYAPFYVSHFGRHGSRYTYDSKVFRHLKDVRKMHDDGILSENGEKLLTTFELLYSHMEGNWGELTGKGAAEHYGIGSRMAKRFSKVWKCDGKTINVYSTESKRVRESRDNFILGFNKFCPTYQNFRVEVGTEASKLATRGYYKESDRSTGNFADTVPVSGNPRLKALLCNDDELSRRLFKEGYKPSGKQINTFRKNLNLLFQREALNEENLPYCDTLVPFGELLFIASKDANYWCHRHGLTSDNEGIGVKIQGLGILKSFIDEADMAIKNDELSATFRFSHDSFLLTIICAMGLDEYSDSLPTLENYTHNFVAGLTCLAGNIQLIFYKKEGSDVLVKILHNEEETLVRGLKPICGPYYKWSDLKKYFVEREKAILSRPPIKTKSHS